MRALVLVVDDDPMMCDLLRLMLERVRFQVDTVPDGRQITTAIKEYQPDVLILNVMLPGINGVDVCRMVRSDPASADLPVIVYSAVTDIATVEAMMQAGANKYLFKPTPPAELIATIYQVLGMVPPG